MHITTAILVLQCALCLTIKVPVTWDDDSEVQPVTRDEQTKYFQYTANKPQFAIDVAKFHDVKSPEKHYESYPINPHTGVNKPDFGKHQLLDSSRTQYKPYQEYVKKENSHGHITPVSSIYEVYHPYQAEVPALRVIYRDPVLSKIRNDVRDSKNRLQKYEHDTGQSDIHKNEYLERPEHIDKKKVPHHNTPTQFEVHKPLRHPNYYQRVPINNHRDHILNQKLRHPWNQNYAKVTPMHYNPLKHNLQRLRQQHALTYDDERNEYPQVLPPERYAEKPDGYDIFEKGKDKYDQIRNSFDESINKDVLKNNPQVNDNLEIQNEDYKNNDSEDSEEIFVPIKNYAQVRKTETYKHLPKLAAFQDAQNLEEIQNAPRLRQAIKSSKNQVVYSEEGYEDTAYDHAGEQKHASDHEGHGGSLKENEVSKGKYKIPTVDIGYTDDGKSTTRDQVLHGEKWNDEHIDGQNENESEDYSENENNYSDKENIEEPDSGEVNERNKRENKGTKNKNLLDHDVAKREVNPNSSHPVSISNLKGKLQKTLSAKHNNEKLRKKYPYYFNNSKLLNKNSPLRYSENLKLIPKKNIDNSAFYNSRITLECPDVESEINPVPDKFKNDDVSDDSDDYDDSEKGEEEFKKFKNKQRLKGLGDKIDCLKVKYFGEDPLDSPFFKEESIHNPIPVLKPNSKVFSVNKFEDKVHLNLNESKQTDRILQNPEEDNIFKLLNKLYDNHTFSKAPSVQYNPFEENLRNISNLNHNPSTIGQVNSNHSHFINNESVSRLPSAIRKKRAATFMYEPYKVIKESQSPDSKRITTSSNVSPLIKKLQTRQVIDKTSMNSDKVYKEVGKNDRPSSVQDIDFIDVSMDQRRGEPRYELDLKNHRSHYSPAENRTSISLEDYKAKTANAATQVNTLRDKKSRNSFHIASTNRPYFDVSKYLPQTFPTQNTAASNSVPKIVRSSTANPQDHGEEDIDEDDYEEYDDEDEEEEEPLPTTTTSTTTKRPVPKKRIRLAPTVKPTADSLKLQLVTRFHTSTTDTTPIKEQKSENKLHTEEVQKSPKYRERKNKSTKSTLVTDTESYGNDDDNDDMRIEEIDAMIGVKQDMDEYAPTYEKEKEKKNRSKDYEKEDINESLDDEENVGEDDDNDDDEDDDDEEDDKESDDESQFRYNDKNQGNSRGYQEDREKTNNRKYKNKFDLDDEQPTLEITTSEPTKRTLVITTEPTSTTEILHSELQPTVFRKKVEIHKELPVNETSQHMTHFKQDIKEFEIIKEMDKPKTNDRKNIESLDLNLYQDENLAKEINNLGDIEIFKDDLDFDSGPQHGGNYRKIKPEDLEQLNQNSTSDVETSETETKKVIELETSTSRARLRSDIIRSRKQENVRNNKRGESSKDTGEISRTATRERNTRQRQSRNRSNDERSAKLIEIQDDENIEHSRNMHGGNFKAPTARNYNRPMHGGNYRSEKLIQDENIRDISTEASTTRRNNVRKRNRKIDAQLLNIYANAISTITTTPAYILDPSKRMYYYVEK